MQGMAQVVRSGSAAVTALEKPGKASRALKGGALGRSLVVSVPSFGRWRRCRSVVVSRVTETTSTTRTVNGSVRQEAAIAKATVVARPANTGFMSVGAVITIVRKQRPSRDEQITNAVDVFSDLTGSKVFLQLVSEEADPG